MDGPDARTRLVLAELYGEVRHRARWDPLSPAEMDEAVAALDEILGERDDGPQLLAQVAGLMTGAAFVRGPEELRRAVVAGSICVAAGADEFLVDGWASIGAERAADAAGRRGAGV